MNAIRAVLMLWMALGICTGLALGQESPPGFGAAAQYRFGVGARALSLGGAYTAVAADAEGLYWNPAGLVWAPLSVGGMYSNPFAGLGSGALDIRYQYLGVVGTARGLGLGGGWFNSHVGGIPLTEDGGTFDYNSSIFLVGGAAQVPLGDKVRAAVGLTGKLYQETMLEGRAQGVGLDAGVLVDFGAVRVAYCSQDVGGTRYRWQGTGQEPEVHVPWVHRVGAAAFWLEGALLTTAEAVLGTDAQPVLRVGAEWTLLGAFALRAGVRLQPIPHAGHRPFLSAGFGVAWSAFVLDAAYLRNPIATPDVGSLSTDTVIFSVGLRF